MPASKEKSKIPLPKCSSKESSATSSGEKPKALGIPTPKSGKGSYSAKYRLKAIGNKPELESNPKNMKVVLPNQDAKGEEKPKGVRGRGSKIPTVFGNSTVAPVAKMIGNPVQMSRCEEAKMNPSIVYKVPPKEKMVRKPQVEKRIEPEPVSLDEKSTPNSTKAALQSQPELSTKINVTMKSGEFKELEEVEAWIHNDCNLEEECYLAYDAKYLTSAEKDTGLDYTDSEDDDIPHVAYIIDNQESFIKEQEGNLIPEQYPEPVQDICTESNEENSHYEGTTQRGTEKPILPRERRSAHTVPTQLGNNTEIENQINAKKLHITNVLAELETSVNPFCELLQDKKDFISDDQEYIDDMEQPEEMQNVISDPLLNVEPNLHENDNTSVEENVEVIPTPQISPLHAVNENLEEEKDENIQEVESENRNEILSENASTTTEKQNNNPVPKKESTEEIIREGYRKLDEIDAKFTMWGNFWIVMCLMLAIVALIGFFTDALKSTVTWYEEVFAVKPEPTWYEKMTNWFSSFKFFSPQSSK